MIIHIIIVSFNISYPCSINHFQRGIPSCPQVSLELADCVSPLFLRSFHLQNQDYFISLPLKMSVSLRFFLFFSHSSLSLNVLHAPLRLLLCLVSHTHKHPCACMYTRRVSFSLLHARTHTCTCAHVH